MGTQSRNMSYRLLAPAQGVSIAFVSLFWMLVVCPRSLAFPLYEQFTYNTADCSGDPFSSYNATGCFSDSGALTTITITNSTYDVVFSGVIPNNSYSLEGMDCSSNGQLHVTIGSPSCDIVPGVLDQVYCISFGWYSHTIKCVSAPFRSPRTSAPTSSPVVSNATSSPSIQPDCATQWGDTKRKCSKLQTKCRPYGYHYKWVPKGYCSPDGFYGCQFLQFCDYSCSKDCLKAGCNWNSRLQTCSW
jgi:hypothetical protein